MTFPAYPNYKSTGVEWLSEIPVRWELIRLRFLLLDGAEGIKIGPFGSQLTSDMLVEIGYKVYGQENVIAGDFDKGQRYITDEKFSEMSVYGISPNDLLVTMMGTAGRCKVVPEAISAGVMDSHLLRMRFGRKADPKFVELLIDKSIYVSHQVRLNGKGSIMHGLNSSIIKELLVALPSADEQASILSFLDHETARIDALIEEQQRLIELLKEKRQAVISLAVTKGLDPTVPMKDSGVEWLGEVPAHWELKKLRHIGHARNGLTYSPEDVVDFSDSATLVLRSSNIQKARISLEDNVYVEKRIPEALRVREGDLLICSRNGSRALIGKNALIPKELDGQSFGAFMMVFRSEVNEFIYWVLNSPIFDYQSSTFLTATINQLTNENLGGMLAPFPPPAEQAEIVLFLTEKTQEIDILISEVQGGVELLYERRAALISAAVTGKIDVRGWQPPVSTQAPESAVAEAD